MTEQERWKGSSDAWLRNRRVVPRDWGAILWRAVIVVAVIWFLAALLTDLGNVPDCPASQYNSVGC